VAFSAGTFSVDENVGQATITVTLDAVPQSEVTVNYRSIDGTAVDPGDYTAVNDTLTFLPPQVSQTFTVPIVNDAVWEPGEVLQLTLNTPVGVVLGAIANATLTIEDDEAEPTVQFSTDTYSVAEDGGQATITVTMMPPSALTVTVPYSSMTGGTATSGADYLAVSDILTFLPSQTSVTFTVTILDDSFAEGDETVNLNLQSPSNALLGSRDQALLAITDNDRTSNTCNPNYPPGEPNLGQPDGEYARVACDEGLIVTLQTPISAGDPPDTGYELIYYELVGVPLPDTGTIYLDLVKISIGNDPGSTDEDDWYDVFYWGDGITDTNTSLVDYTGPPDVPPGCPSTYLDTGPEVDNLVICDPPLVGPTGWETGIQIDVDNSPIESVPAGNYSYVRIFSLPLGVGEDDGPEVDSLEVLP
jgi:hypothetical protein